jgi:hypothetical protein
LYKEKEAMQYNARIFGEASNKEHGTLLVIAIDTIEVK